MRLPEGVGLRPAVAADLPLLLCVYCSTRQDELAAVDWDAPQKAAFLQQQFDLQHRYYHAHFPDAQFCIVQCQGRDIGRWYLDRAGAELRLIDIALLPAWRQRGIGSQLLRSLVAEADASGKDILLHVEANNPALGMYARLGFEPLANDGVYVKLRRPPAARSVEASVEECR
jgi:ribosomal protein S18 acetylase RimI-like enzyme